MNNKRSRLHALVRRASRGDVDAFGRLVRDFQDMAVGYALSLLGDFHAAEDAAQEAFIAAYGKLSELRDPAAFPGWLRMVVRTACSRMRRKSRLATVPLEAAALAAARPGEANRAEHEGMDILLAAVRSLPEGERAAIALFYVSDYSHREIAAFLGIPETTVQGRLHMGRKRLKERVLKMAEDNLRWNAPSRSSRFEDRVKRLIRPKELESDETLTWHGGRGTDVWEMITASIRGDLATIKKLVAKDPGLANCSNQYRPPLHFAVQENHIDVVKFLLEHGANPTHRSGNPWHERPLVIAEERGYDELKHVLETHIAEKHGAKPKGEKIAAAVRARDIAQVKGLLDADPELIEALDERGNRPLHWAALVRSTEIAGLLLERGAEINMQRPDGARPLDLTNGDYWFRKKRDVPEDGPTQLEMSRFFIEHGATYDITAAAKLGDIDRVRELLDEDPSVANRVPDYCTYYNGVPLWESVANGYPEITKLLLDRGADPSIPEPGIAHGGRVLVSAIGRRDLDLARDLLERGADPNAAVESGDSAMAAAIKWTEALELMAPYGGTIPDYKDLGDVPEEALGAIYGDALPLKYYVDTQDTDTLAARFDEDPALIREALGLAARRYGSFKTDVIRLCLERDPDAAKTIHCNGMIYKLHGKHEDELLEPFRLLLEAGMTPNDPNWMRVTPLHLLALGATVHGTDGTAYRPHPKMMALFIKHGADLDARDEEYSSTPLGWAARWGRKEAVELLLARGAKTNLPDDPPWATPLAWAVKKGHMEVEAMLRDAGAKQ